MKFLADRMLGSLSSWLRILGFDTISANSFVGLSNSQEDTFMLKLSELERRTLLTRDVQLHIRASQKYGIPTLLVDDGDVMHQLNQVRREFGLVFPHEPPVVRCSVCNGSLKQAAIQAVTQSCEVRTLRTRGVNVEKFIKTHVDYYECCGCGKIFWKGQQWRNMLQRTRQLSHCDTSLE